MDKIENDIKKHVFMINKTFDIEDERIINSEIYGDFVSYANSSPQTRSIFACTDEKKLLELYNNKLLSVCNIINSTAKYDIEKIICIMEYMRLMVTYEFICAPGNESNKKIKNSAHTFAGSGLNAAITGRGICQSQASFCRDILNHLGIDAEIEYASGESDSHAVVLVQGRGVLDPTNYVGSIETLAGGKLFDEYRFRDKNYKDFTNIDKDIFEICKNNIQLKLIDVLGLKQISQKFEFNQLTQDERQYAIWYLITRNIDLSDLPINSTTINVNGFPIEISNLLELLYKANNIPIERSQSVQGKFKHESYSVYKTQINNKRVKIIPRYIMSITSDKKRGVMPISYNDSLTKCETYSIQFNQTKILLESQFKNISSAFNGTNSSNELELN